MGSIFKYGDKVLAGKHAAKVVSIRNEDGKYFCTVKFDDINLIPSELEYDEKWLKLEYSPDKHCPICGEEYNVIKFNMHVWKDCKKCKDKKENLEKRHADEKNEHINKTLDKSDEDLLEEFEKMLNDDDDDDFGFYQPTGIY